MKYIYLIVLLVALSNAASYTMDNGQLEHSDLGSIKYWITVDESQNITAYLHYHTDVTHEGLFMTKTMGQENLQLVNFAIPSNKDLYGLYRINPITIAAEILRDSIAQFEKKYKK